MVERRITGEPTSEITTESITVETPEDELTIENVEMTEDGGAIINPIEVAPENKFDANLAEQPESAMTGLRVFYTVFPAIGTLIAIYVMKNYDINEERAKEISSILAERNKKTN